MRLCVAYGHLHGFPTSRWWALWHLDVIKFDGSTPLKDQAWKISGLHFSSIRKTLAQMMTQVNSKLNEPMSADQKPSKALRHGLTYVQWFVNIFDLFLDSLEFCLGRHLFRGRTHFETHFVQNVSVKNWRHWRHDFCQLVKSPIWQAIRISGISGNGDVEIWWHLSTVSTRDATQRWLRIHCLWAYMCRSLPFVLL